MLTRDAALIWGNLRGLLCVYKPAETKVRKLREIILSKLCEDLNALDVRPPTQNVLIEGDPTQRMDVVVQPNLADHPAVVGPRYLPKEAICSWTNHLGFNTSGVLLFTLKSGRIAKNIRENRPTRAYRIQGTLGSATDNFFKTGKVVEKTTFKHVKLFHIENLLASMQASHQKKMFELCGVDMQSQAAYELACQGPIRPANSKLPVLYGIKCVDFDSPNFTVEVQCVNEYEDYLKALIHEIGVKLRSSAHCTAIQCIRHSYFTLEDALLLKHWNLQNLMSNLERCNRTLQENDSILRQKNVALQQM